MEYKREYSKELEELIENFKFTEEQEQEFNEAFLLIKGSTAHKVFKDMYIFYINDFSTSEIAKIYNRSQRTIQSLFKKVGLNRDKFESQKIASKKRDYVKIRRTLKKTMKERYMENNLFGSKIEQYVRIEILQMLENIIPYEVIVGINSVLGIGELDIPIIIFKNDKAYKFGIEVNGHLFHKDRSDRDNEKLRRLKEDGYKAFALDTKAYFKDEKIVREKELKKNIQSICNKIKEILDDV